MRSYYLHAASAARLSDEVLEEVGRFLPEEEEPQAVLLPEGEAHRRGRGSSTRGSCRSRTRASFEKEPIRILEFFRTLQKTKSALSLQARRNIQGALPAVGGRVPERPGGGEALPRDPLRPGPPAGDAPRDERDAASSAGTSPSSRPSTARCSGTSTTSTRWTSTPSGARASWREIATSGTRGRPEEEEFPGSTRRCRNKALFTPRDPAPRHREGEGARAQPDRRGDRGAHRRPVGAAEQDDLRPRLPRRAAPADGQRFAAARPARHRADPLLRRHRRDRPPGSTSSTCSPTRT